MVHITFKCAYVLLKCMKYFRISSVVVLKIVHREATIYHPCIYILTVNIQTGNTNVNSNFSR